MKRSILQTFLWTTFLFFVLTSIFWTSGFAQSEIEVPVEAKPDTFFFSVLFCLLGVISGIFFFFRGRYVERVLDQKTSLAMHMREANEIPSFLDIMFNHKFLSVLLFILSFFVLVMLIDLIV
jgi:hypothetical protein